MTFLVLIVCADSCYATSSLSFLLNCTDIYYPVTKQISQELYAIKDFFFAFSQIKDKTTLLGWNSLTLPALSFVNFQQWSLIYETNSIFACLKFISCNICMLITFKMTQKTLTLILLKVRGKQINYKNTYFKSTNCKIFIFQMMNILDFRLNILLGYT